MERRFRALLGFACWMSLVATAIAAEDDATHVKLRIVGADGRPVVRKVVDLIPVGPSASRITGGEPVTRTTDDDGQVDWTEPASEAQRYVVVKGVGFGFTERFAGPAGGLVRPQTLRLVPYGSIAGRLPEKLRGLEVSVMTQPIADAADRRSTTRRIEADDDGHFVLDDWPPGYCLLWLNSASDTKYAASVTVWPGRRSKVREFHVAVRLVPGGVRPAPAPPTPEFGGMVRDLSGRPIAGASVVFGFASSGPHRETVLTTETDEGGRWSLRDDRLRTALTSTEYGVSAYKAGYVPAFIAPRAPPTRSAAGGASDGEAAGNDLVLSDQGGKLRVRVLEQGKPVEAIDVAIRYEGSYPLAKVPFEVPAELKALRKPAGVTNAAGTVEFVDLLPGCYTVAACRQAGRFTWLEGSGRPSDPKTPFAVAEGVTVSAGATPSIDLAIFRHAGEAKIRLVDAERRALVYERIEGDVSSDGVHNLGFYGMRPDPVTGAFHVGTSTGLMNIELRRSLAGERRTASAGGPRMRAAGMVGVSRLLESPAPIEFEAGLADHGSLRLRIRDADDRPLEGYVVSTDNYGDRLGERTDERGEIVRRAAGRRNRVIVYPADPSDAINTTELTTARALALSDKRLTNRRAFQPEFLDVPDDSDTVLTIRPRPAGYVRGRIRPAPGRKPSDYQLTEPYRSEIAEFRSWYDDETGEFLLGPFPEGEERITAIDKRATTASARFLQVDVEVRATKVARIEIDAGKPLEPLFSPLGFPERRRRIAGMVYEADGRTPAHGAKVIIVRPNYDGPTMTTAAGADGGFSSAGELFRPRSYTAIDRYAPIKKRPAAVAWLPGRTGPAVVPLRDDTDLERLRIVLPAAREVRGQVTVRGDKGRESTAGRPNVFQVAAVRVDENPYEQFARPASTPLADGSFTLGGLAAGTYRVQALMDGIWPSNVVEVKVRKDQELTPIELEIVRPGLPIRLRVVDGEGAPRVRLPLHLAADGPLVERLRAWTPVTDGRGTVLLPPLAAGRHELRVADGDKRYAFEVPPITGSAVATPEIELRIER